MKLFTVLFAAIGFAGFASAQTASSKATAAINTVVGCTFAATTTGDTLPISCHDIFLGKSVPVTADKFVTVMTSTIKVSNSQSLFVSPSIVTGLYTQTKTRTTPGTSSTAVAEGGVYERAIVTNTTTGAVQMGYPVAACAGGVIGCQQSAAGEFGVTLDSRVQTLSQDISTCVVNVVVGGISGSGTCNFTLTTNLILRTTSAHTFNFIFPNVGVGTYRVDVQVAVNAGASVIGLGTAAGGAVFGLGSVTIESARLVHDFSF